MFSFLLFLFLSPKKVGVGSREGGGGRLRHFSETKRFASNGSYWTLTHTSEVTKLEYRKEGWVGFFIAFIIQCRFMSKT